MGILSVKPTSLNKNTNFTLTCSKASLQALISDSYYLDDTNWKKVVLYYRDATGSQKTYVAVDAVAMTGVIKVSARARGNTWQLYKVLVQDFDGGALIIKRASLDSSDDIVVSN
jgi:hypothetical protein